jgi:hypothetical protein
VSGNLLGHHAIVQTFEIEVGFVTIYIDADPLSGSVRDPLVLMLERPGD